MSFREKDFSVRGLRLRVKHWHEAAPRKVIALHGWLDNAASFDVLAPLLPQCSIAALDLAGQGFSDHRPPSATYHLWDDLVDILDIADQLGWQEFSVIGHSRGAMLAVMLAASCPERVSQLLLIDGLMPVPVNVEDSPAQLAKFITDSRREREHRCFDTREQAIAVRARAGGIPESVAELLAERQLRQNGSQWYWDVDERLKNASAVKMTEAHNRAFLQAVKCHVDIVLTNGGWDSVLFSKCVRAELAQFHWHEFEGHHHFHMGALAGDLTTLLG